jgi:predicted enzyme related to lactoylglutathione lyase
MAKKQKPAKRSKASKRSKPATRSKPAKRSAVKRSAKTSASASPPSHEFTHGLYGWITHTDLASTNAGATRAWCIEVLGWIFRPPFPMPGGDYHLFAFSENGGGGVRQIGPSEQPSSLPYVHVENAQASYDAALRAGAESVSPPTRVMEGVTIALVRAPGGVLIGLSGP